MLPVHLWLEILGGGGGEGPKKKEGKLAPVPSLFFCGQWPRRTKEKGGERERQKKGEPKT